MSWVLFQRGSQTAPKTARRRLLWAIVTLPPMLLISVLLTIGAISNWIAIAGHDGAGASPELGETILLSVFALLFSTATVYTVVVGGARIREQRRIEIEAVREAAEAREHARQARERFLRGRDQRALEDARASDATRRLRSRGRSRA